MANGQAGTVGVLSELNDWHNLETVWKVPAGASIAEAQDIVNDCEAEYLGVDGGAGIVALSPGRYDWPGGSTLLCRKTATSIVGPLYECAVAMGYRGSDNFHRFYTSSHVMVILSLREELSRIAAQMAADQ